jgi:hypothetical protein
VERPVSDRTSKIEVYSTFGALIAEIASGIPIRMMGPVIITDDRVYGFTSDRDGVSYFVAYRIVRGD